jgi:eukaryotic-like serine/threonine-protein kinase
MTESRAMSGDTATRLTTVLADRYRIERELGAGGMATVYLAQDIKHDRKVAIKVLRPELAAVLGAERFLSEIKVTANLQHPNLLPLFDSGEGDGLLYYVMPFIEGETLRARLDREQQLPVDETVRLVALIAGALDFAHARGVIHRDLKPENILLQAGQPVIADFGIALAVSNAGGERVTQTGLSLGTPHYMSPEQAAGDRAVDARSDQYALAAVTYEMLTGEPPHTGATAQVIIARLMTETPRSIRSARPAVPTKVDAAAQRALSKAPADRFPTCGDFARALTADPSALVTSPQSRLRVAIGVLSATAIVASAVAWQRRMPAAGANLSSIAVLPFADGSAATSDAHLGDGIAETLISALAKVPELEVAARTSAFSFRGRGEDLAEIGRKLNVATVLEGSVQRVGDRIRVTSELVNVGTRRTMWSETFDRAAADIFAVQDDVAREVITALKGRLLAERSAVRTSNATRDPEAYDLYLRGRFFWNRRNAADLTKSIGLFESAIARDSTFTLAWVGLADAWVTSAFWSGNAATALPRARVAAERAVALNPQLGEGLATLAYLLMVQDWNWSASDSVFRLAVERSPRYATGLKWYSDLLTVVERRDEALAFMNKARDLDPLSPIIYYNLGYAYEDAGRRDDALASFEKALEIDPTLPAALDWASREYLERGDTAKYFDARSRLDAISKIAGARVDVLRRAYASGGREGVWRAQLAEPSTHDFPFDRAVWHARLGENDAAFRELERAYATRSIWMPYLSTSFLFKQSFRRDPRFLSLLQRMHLPESATPDQPVAKGRGK